MKVELYLFINFDFLGQNLNYNAVIGMAV